MAIGPQDPIEDVPVETTLDEDIAAIEASAVDRAAIKANIAALDNQIQAATSVRARELEKLNEMKKPFDAAIESIRKRDAGK